MQRKKDELNKLDKEIDFMMYIGPNAYPEIIDKKYIARRYEKVAEKLTDKVRKDIALLRAAEWYCNSSCHECSIQDLEKALKVYRKMDSPKKEPEKVKNLIKDKYRTEARITLRDITNTINYNRPGNNDFRRLHYLPEELEKCGFSGKAKIYRTIIKKLANLAEKDYNSLKKSYAEKC